MSFTVGENPEKTIDLSHENNKLYQTMCAYVQVNRITIRLINNVLEE
jgi:hypothetical protein